MKHENLIFYTHYHIGDVIMAKPFIKEIAKHIEHDYLAYAHLYSPKLTNDLCNHIDIRTLPFLSDDTFSTVRHNSLFINTWFGKLQGDESCPSNTEDRSICNYELFVPRYSYYLKQQINKNLSLDYMVKRYARYCTSAPTDCDNVILNVVPHLISSKLKVLIYNQMATSGQSDNLPYDDYIHNLSVKFPHIQIYTSLPCTHKLDNVISLRDVFAEKNPNMSTDIIELGAVSKYCDIICGPGNGPLQYTWFKENITNPDKQYFTINCNNAGEAQWSADVSCSNTVVSTTPQLFSELEDYIQKFIKRHKDERDN